MELSYALIADIVGSRDLDNRAEAQGIVLDVLERCAAGLDVRESPYPTVGDEFQAVASTLRSALALTLRAHLLLPEHVGLRFGIGIGVITEVAATKDNRIEDGSAWWAARDAIDWAHVEQDKGRAFIRTRIRGAASGERIDDEGIAVLNAFLTVRDHEVFAMGVKQRRTLGALIIGQTQSEIARAEKRSQSAISQFVRGVGAGILRAEALLADLDKDPPSTSSSSHKGGVREKGGAA